MPTGIAPFHKKHVEMRSDFSCHSAANRRANVATVAFYIRNSTPSETQFACGHRMSNHDLIGTRD